MPACNITTIDIAMLAAVDSYSATGCDLARFFISN